MLSHTQHLSLKYLPELDGLRALSVLGVISAHMHSTTWHWLNGGRGLTWFFILSGYLITRLCLREEANCGRVSLTAFYVRRAFRILPLYYVVLAAYCFLILALGMSPDKRDGLLAALPYYLTYLPEVPTILGVGVDVTKIPFAHSWSLGIEEKFYLVWPVLAFWLLRRNNKGRFVALLALYLTFGSAAFFKLGEIEVILYSYSNILAGCLLAFVLNDLPAFSRLQRFGRTHWAFAFGLALAILHFGVSESDSPSMTLETAAVRSGYTALSTFALGCLLTGSGWLKRALGMPMLLIIGKVSYGMYLLHRLCLNLVEVVVGPLAGRIEGTVEFLLTCVLSFIVAYAVHVVVEKPCIQFGRGWALRLSEPLPVPAHCPASAGNGESVLPLR